MKVLTKEEEDAHYQETLKGGALGGIVGLSLGVTGVYVAATRYPAFRQLTLPLRAFLVTSSTTFGAIVSADHFSRTFEKSRHPDENYEDDAARARALQYEQKSSFEKFMAWGKEHRYPIVAGSWVASMGLALGLVGRNPYLSTTQKLVQARVYAQTLTVGVLIATAVFEIGDQNKGEGRWETVKLLDPDDPEHKHLIEKKVHHERYPGEDQWRDMVESEEQKMEARREAAKEQERRDEKAGKVKPKDKEHKKQAAKKEDKKEDKKDKSEGDDKEKK